MAKSKKVNLPASYGGLMRVSESESKIQIPPETVIALIGGVILLEILLHSGNIFF